VGDKEDVPRKLAKSVTKLWGRVDDKLNCRLRGRGSGRIKTRLGKDGVNLRFSQKKDRRIVEQRNTPDSFAPSLAKKNVQRGKSKKTDSARTKYMPIHRKV